MKTELRHQLSELVDAGAEPLTFAEIKRSSPARHLGRAWSLRQPRRAATLAGGVAAAGLAAVLAITLAGSPAGGHADSNRTGHAARHPAPEALTVAMVRHLASASRLALACSGHAVVSYRHSGSAVEASYGTDDITFSGANWNYVTKDYLVHPDAGVANPQYAVNRVIGGQAYDYIPTTSRQPHWIHDTSPNAARSLDIPDPRTLLSALRPDAGFTVAGYQVIGGARLEHLRATSLADLSGFAASLRWRQPGERLTALDIWADSAGVVHRMAMSLAGRTAHYPITFTEAERAALDRAYHGHATMRDVIREHGHGVKPVYRTVATSLTVTFSGIGQPQKITAPADAVGVDSHG